MKTKVFIKITAIAVIAILAAISCAPEASLTSYDWDDYNQQYDPSKNTSPLPGTFTAPNIIYNDLGVNPSSPPLVFKQEVTIKIDSSSDALRVENSKLVEEFKKFLSFYTFTNPVATYNVGTVATLSTPIDYILVKRNANVVTFKLSKEFVSADSDVLVKYDVSKYTFAHGMKVDTDGNGTAGEEFYDDFYDYIPVSGVTGPSTAAGIQGKNADLQISLLTSPFSYSTPVTLTNIWVAYVKGFSVSSGADEETVNETVFSGYAGNFSIQKNNALSGWKWEKTPVPVSYKKTTKAFEIDSIKLEDNTAYRVVYEGPTWLTTANDYYGIKQRIKVTGNNVPYNKHDPEIIKSNAGFYTTTSCENRTFYYGSDSVSLYSKDNSNKNVVIDITCNTPINGTYDYYYKQIENESIFKDNFKIAYSPTSFSDFDDFQKSANVAFIGISKVEYLNEIPLDASYEKGYKTIRLTLDPAYKVNGATKYFYINNKIGFDDNKSTFGDTSNWEFGSFQLYYAGSVF
ncbi:MAG: hypothetical protein LBV17_12305 [Treponema sp.]|jgi:hypothetical protein|nr:hypothetical protein [Treponema sp.]